MARILAIDFGEKRTGIAVSDVLQLIANGLTTVDTSQLEQFLVDYVAHEPVERFVVGFPKTLRNEPAAITDKIMALVERLRRRFPHIPVDLVDERFTSKIAFQAMIDGGLKKKARQNKAMIDQVSATILLEEYLERQHLNA
ncbi:MAG: Holliday junction resolvase RuvX [Paludibacteraceae bacterium]